MTDSYCLHSVVCLPAYMMPGYLHHIQWSVASLQQTSQKLRAEYGMREVAVREDRGRREVVLQSGLVTFLVSETGEEVMMEGDQTDYPWLSSGRKGEGGETDSVFNICLEVGDVRETYQRMTGAGSLSISPPRDLSVEEGTVSVAVVSSPCSQVIHSLVNTTRYSGRFLPGFTRAGEEREDGEEETEDLISHIDHITLVCEPGDSRDILAWYSTTCGMQPFLLAQEDMPGEGTVFQEAGLRLNVSSWVTDWLCREEGVTWDQGDTERNFKLVLAEPLPDNEESHVKKFLRDHGGPGVQHIGLATLDITHTVSVLTNKGAEFRKPPPTYYALREKQEEIQSIGRDTETFKQLGILIDKEQSEANQSKTADSEQSDQFILQIFSSPVFGAETFFLEIIERRNSRGFGGGNIRALAQSIILMNDMTSLREKLESGKMWSKERARAHCRRKTVHNCDPGTVWNNFSTNLQAMDDFYGNRKYQLNR